MSGPANEIVGEQAKLFRRLQAFENSILIRTQVQYLRFLVEMVRTGAVTPGPLSLPTLFSAPMGRPAVRSLNCQPKAFEPVKARRYAGLVCDRFTILHLHDAPIQGRLAEMISIRVSAAHHFYSRA
jgi:hypothetical protein